MRRVPETLIAAALIALGVVAFWYDRIILPPKTSPFASDFGNLDFYTQILPMSARGAEWIRQGILPLWNPYQTAGHPFLATGLYGVLYPFNFPYLLLRTEVAIEAVVALHMVMAGWIVWLYAREIGLTRIARYVAAAAYVGSGFAASQASWFTPAVASSTWLPLALFAVERTIARRDGRSAMLLAFAVAMALLGGWVQFWLYSMYAIAFYASARLVALARRPATRPHVVPVAALLGIAVALGGALTAAQALPTRELQALGPRRPGGLTADQQLAFPSLKPVRLAAEAIDRRVSWPYISTFLTGPIVLSLVAWSVFSSRGTSRVVSLWVIALASLLTCLGSSTPFYREVYLRLPAAAWFRVPQRAVFPLVCTLALLAGYGADALATRKGRLRGVGLVASLVILAGSTVILLNRYPPPMRDLLVVALAAVALLAMALRSGPRIRTSLSAIMLALVVAWSVVVTTNIFSHPYHHPEAARAQAPIFAYVREHQGLDRTFLADPNGFHYGVMAKQGSLEGIYSITDYEPLSLMRFKELYDTMRVPPTADMPFVGELNYDPANRNSGLLDALSVRFVVAPHDSAVSLRLRSSAGVWRYVPMLMGSGYELYEATNPLPRAYVASHVVTVPDRAAGLAVLTTPGFDVRKSVVVEKSTEGARPASGWFPTPVVPARITRYEPREVVVDVDAPAAGVLVLTDTWYPGWKATVDGTPTEILPANHVLRAVPIAAGRHQVVFRYEPKPFVVGLWISGAAMIAMVAIAVVNPRW